MAETPDHNSRILSGISDLYGLHQLIQEPTRITESSSTMIDLIFTNTCDKIACSGVSHISISDHSLIYAYRKLAVTARNKTHTTVTYRNFKNFNLNNFRSDIGSQNWQSVISFDNPNDMWCAWKSIFENVVEKHAPLHTKRVRSSQSPWVTPHLKELMRKRDSLKTKAINSNNPEDWLAFKSMRNCVNNDIKTAKQNYYNTAFEECSNDPKKTWRIVNELTSRNQAKNKSFVKEIKIGDTTITDPKELAEKFNNHFVEIGPKLAAKIPPFTNGRSHLDFVTIQPPNANFKLNPTNSSTVFSLLSKLCTSKATGLDNISAGLLRDCSDIIADSLCSIFNQSIETGIFPDDWKCAKVLPLYKQEERNDMTNYRPISIIPIVCKVFERIVYDQIYTFLIQNNILNKYQSGFRSLHSTVTALLEATNSWSLNIDQGNVNAVVFLDLKKAFDTIDHSILLSKLTVYGFEISAKNWFMSYLNNRTQQCLVNNHLSNKRSLKCGIPQGTILGPLLFLLYINDLPNCLTYSHPRMYADDTHLTYANDNIEDINFYMNEDLKCINEWLIANKLTLNLTKTEFMLIGSRQRLATFDSQPNLSIDRAPIKIVEHSKCLGVFIDKNLSWNEHIAQLTRKIASGIGALKRVRPFVPSTTLQYIYSSLIQPRLDYCCVVWDKCNSTPAERLQKLQNRAARVLTYSSYDTNADLLIQSLGWKKLDAQRKMQKAIQVYKALNNLSPHYLCSLFTKHSSKYLLRDKEDKLAIPKPRTNYMKNSFSYDGAVIWNSLPSKVRQAKNINHFKAGCSSFFN